MARFASVNEKAARIYGQWSYPGDKLYLGYRFLINLCQVLYITVQCLYLTLDIDVASGIRTANMIALSIVSLYRTVVWLLNESKMQKLINRANNPEVFDNNHKTVIKAHNFSKLHSIFLINSTEFLICISYGPCLFSLWRATDDDLRSIKVPYRVWFPFDIYQSKPHLFGAICYQIFGLYVNGHLLTCVTSTYTSLMGHVGGQMKFLAYKFRQLAESGRDIEPKFRECVQHLNNTIE